MTENMRQTAQERVCRQIGAAHEQDTASDGTWQQNGQEGPMESLAGLRAYVGRHARMDEMTKASLLVYAREIEREVKELTDERDMLKRQWEAGVDFDQRLEACADNREDVTLWGVDYTALPVDADGVPIHVGDVMDEQLPFGCYADPAPVDTMELSRGASGYGWMVRLDSESGAFINPKLLRHHHVPTVEDVLEEFVARWMETHHDDIPALKAEYAAKLRLAGEE